MTRRIKEIISSAYFNRCVPKRPLGGTTLLDFSDCSRSCVVRSGTGALADPGSISTGHCGDASGGAGAIDVPKDSPRHCN